MAARARPVTDPTEVAKVMNLLLTRFPEYAVFPMPQPEEIRFTVRSQRWFPSLIIRKGLDTPILDGLANRTMRNATNGVALPQGWHASRGLIAHC
jgi:hypothetical protein